MFLLVTAPFVGNDVTRLAFPGGVLLVTLALPWVAADRRAQTWGPLLALASIFIWAPTAPLIATQHEYVLFYYPWSRTVTGLLVAGVGCAIWLATSLSSRGASGCDIGASVRPEPERS